MPNAACHGDIGNVRPAWASDRWRQPCRTPNLVRSGHGQLSQQMGIDLVARCRFRRVWLAIKGLDAHPLHADRHMQPPNCEALLPQKPLHHPATRKRILHVQLVDPAHQFEIIFADGARLVIQTARLIPSRSAWRLRLKAWSRSVISLRSATDRPSRALCRAFAAPPGPRSLQIQKIILQRQLANLRVQRSDIDLRLFRRFGLVVEDIRHAVEDLILPLLDLVRINIELRRMFAHRLVTLQSRQRDFVLESRAVVPSWSSCHLRSVVPATLPDKERKIHLSQLFRFVGPILSAHSLRSYSPPRAYRSERVSWAVWTDLSKMKVATKATMDRKFLAVFSQRSATRLKRLSFPIICSMRARPW